MAGVEIIGKFLNRRGPKETLSGKFSEDEKQAWLGAIRTAGTIKGASRLLGIDKNTLNRRLAANGMSEQASQILLEIEQSKRRAREDEKSQREGREKTMEEARVATLISFMASHPNASIRQVAEALRLSPNNDNIKAWMAKAGIKPNFWPQPRIPLTESQMVELLTLYGDSTSGLSPKEIEAMINNGKLNFPRMSHDTIKRRIPTGGGIPRNLQEASNLSHQKKKKSNRFRHFMDVMSDEE